MFQARGRCLPLPAPLGRITNNVECGELAAKSRALSISRFPIRAFPSFPPFQKFDPQLMQYRRRDDND